ncbi:glycosyltransferase family 2 protein [Daedalea quercina L-15889]|uniref:chitin synthase n=1 Tax=Daedalea quercina L-15889 TaxID=1314783 RepID=A0A165N1D0_9APHY|nr:glycosyltransferase family 2 protein [Daedalea quercina L-15889]
MGLKPVQAYAPLDDEDDLAITPPQQREPPFNAFHELTRYTLSETGMAAPADHSRTLEYAQNYQPSSTTPALRFSRSSPSRHPSLPPVPEATEENSNGSDRASTRGSVSSGSTYVGPLNEDPKEKSSIHIVPSSGFDYGALPTITSGEPLEWDDGQYSGERDPFSDYSNHGAITPQHTSYTDYYSTAGESAQDHGYESAQWQPPSRPASAYSSAATSIHPSHTGYPYQQQPELETSYTGSQSAIDHFRHDTEAYASGSSSRASYRPPRSRSPTPAVDDEDYHIVGNDSVHYTGYSPQRRTRSQAYDEEEDVGHSRTYQYGGGSFYGEKPWQSTIPQVDPEKSSLSTTGTPHTVPGTPVDTRHFGPVPAGRMVRRRKTKKRVQLTNGNLVMQLDVPPKLIMPWKIEPEMKQTRYTAVTCDPDDFEKNGYFLRQNELGRTTELFIVITMYNEDEVLFCRTLYGVMQNISHLCQRKNSRTWGPDAWKKVVVCIVADGRSKVHPRILDCLTLLGVYQPGAYMQKEVNRVPTTVHLFEYTTSFGLDADLHFKYPDKGVVPTQIIFCMKAKNQKKINSHRWFFNAFAPLLQPNVCVLLDVGTRPGPKSIYHLWKAFDLNSNVAGACGEIAAYKGKRWSALTNPLVAAQNFEYKIANILDKPTESLFGYISVLPGAFSAYRYIALQNDKTTGKGPLASYFKGEVLHGRDTDIFTSNMYLAEDRILCFELVAKANSSWILKYVKSAIAETDVPDALPEFISQRRRWLNGSFFAATYAVAHLGQILRSGHSVWRKVTLVMETIYNVINLIASWFAIGNFYLFFIILTSSLEDPAFGMEGIKYWNSVAQFVMGAIVVATFLFSMGNKPKASKWKYQTTAILLAFMMIYLLFSAVMCAVKAAEEGSVAFQTMIFSLIITYGVYFVSSLLAMDPWHIFTSFLPYLLLSPTYINVLNIYAFSNLDDISWGTKQDTEVESDLGAVIQNSNSQVDIEVVDAAAVDDIYKEALENIKYKRPSTKPSAGSSLAEQEQAAKDYYANVRTNVLLAWVLSNAVLLLAILGGGDAATTFSSTNSFSRTKAYMTFILAFVAVTTIVRFLGSTMYLVARVFTC